MNAAKQLNISQQSNSARLSAVRSRRKKRRVAGVSPKLGARAKNISRGKCVRIADIELLSGKTPFDRYITRATLNILL
jgi:hypothetical protein